ncbi:MULTISPECIES: heme utilization cystosolic carrier protein HutX [unclassified Gilliamella]|uniref:heme utilization cystosolic carrier protein HutX n=1 Tax=unclassified Gilliamella TaxID=2685620 RepID=UPI00226A3C2A|nr:MULTISPECIES: heme utilization cystosolic carrier protein HutX [unclassified Gilliamella]MCX8641793.1 heme utilization cystosolic carrier protein HutX [Gilliamella sp. B3835]MCX8706593.1 heme utilization cystosolic carrier protein HutX [Gilliamella sp. B3783]MCX8708938.1 heme utilization cystosolic carrier protein HutX [Gilliamella sp. B3780]MCX8713722.1 heme utilization cystosolic carrier protein HutX [Gilliamella sp. B3781]MCX8715803.1 heme utilization cystosolic carrier protein HutX [Gil
MVDKQTHLTHLATYMQTNPEDLLEKIAQDYQVTLTQVIQAMSESKIVDGDHFDAIWDEVTTWGDVMFLIHTGDIIAEISGELPPGTHSQKYFNLRHQKGLSGHIKAEHCQYIAFIERKFMKMSTASMIFLNHLGQSMFKIFVGRDENHQLKADQLEKFRALMQKFN